MTKKELITIVCGDTGYDEHVVTCIHEALITAMTKALINGNRIDMRGFGNLVVVPRKATKGRNILAGTSVFIPATKKPKFVPSAYLMGKINEKK